MSVAGADDLIAQWVEHGKLTQISSLGNVHWPWRQTSELWVAANVEGPRLSAAQIGGSLRGRATTAGCSP